MYYYRETRQKSQEILSLCLSWLNLSVLRLTFLLLRVRMLQFLRLTANFLASFLNCFDHELTVCYVGVFTNDACKVKWRKTYIWRADLVIAFSKTAFISLAFNIIQPERIIPTAKRVTTWGGNGLWVAKLPAYHVTHIDSQVSITKRAAVIQFHSASIWSWAIN